MILTSLLAWNCLTRPQKTAISSLLSGRPTGGPLNVIRLWFQVIHRRDWGQMERQIAPFDVATLTLTTFPCTDGYCQSSASTANVSLAILRFLLCVCVCVCGGGGVKGGGGNCVLPPPHHPTHTFFLPSQLPLPTPSNPATIAFALSKYCSKL